MLLQQNIKILCEKEGVSEGSLFSNLGINKQSVMELNPTELNTIAQYFGLNIDHLVNKNVAFDVIAAQADIKLLILDIDGVMTDAGMYFTENGDQIKKYNAKDGMAIIHLTKNNFPVGVISSGFSDNMIRQRMEMLKIPKFHVGRNPKIEVLQGWMDEMGITIKNVAFIGDDINDLEIMQQCGLAICPNNAVKAIQNIAHIILTRNGGDACVREYIDTYLLPNIDLAPTAF